VADIRALAKTYNLDYDVLVELCKLSLPLSFSGHDIQFNDVPLPSRPVINFTGSGVTVSDSPTKTVVSVTAGTGGSSNSYFPSGW
jgi:hypothetical protein